MHFLKLSLILFLLLILDSCNEDTTKSNTPESVSYEIISEKTRAGAMTIENTTKMNEAGIVNICSLDIQLSNKVDENTLYSIATELRKTRKQYDKLWIFYWLSSSSSSSMTWATTHFTPDLEIQILGTNKVQDKTMVDSTTVNGEIIGKWKDTRPSVESTYILFKDEANVYKMKKIFPDGSSGFEEITASAENNRFDIVGSKFGEYFIIQSNGNLVLYDSDGNHVDFSKM